MHMTFLMVSNTTSSVFDHYELIASAKYQNVLFFFRLSTNHIFFILDPKLLYLFQIPPAMKLTFFSPCHWTNQHETHTFFPWQKTLNNKKKNSQPTLIFWGSRPETHFICIYPLQHNLLFVANS